MRPISSWHGKAYYGMIWHDTANESMEHGVIQSMRNLILEIDISCSMVHTVRIELQYAAA